MSRACKTLHKIEFTDADGLRKTIAAGQVVEAGVIPDAELDTLVGLKAVRLFDPLDHDRNGKQGGSMPGRRRKTAKEPTAPVASVEPETADTADAPPAPVEEGLLD